MSIDPIKTGREKVFSYAAIGILLVYGILGLFLFDDYGCGPDEGMERQTSLVTLKYVLKTFNLPVPEKRSAVLDELPELKEYRDRYYGTALHFPVVLIEYFSDFRFEPAQFYSIRHLYTFLNYFAGCICFYLLLSERFGSRKYGIAGMLMMILTPRFFAESFYNNKDVIFTAWYVICAFLMSRWFRRKDLKNSILLALVLAITCNTRLNAIVFVPVIMALCVFEAFCKKQFKPLRYMLLTLILLAVFFYALTPNFWEDPIRIGIETLEFNMRHPNHGSEGNLFNGIPVDAAQTYSYIPVWIALTVPTVYLFFSILGTGVYSITVLSELFRREFRTIHFTDAIMFLSGFAAAAFIILTHVTIYNGWRHCYFLLSCILYFAVYFLQLIDRKLSVPIVNYSAYVILAASLLYNGCWIAANHPFEFDYFAVWARSSASNYSGDYWGISTRALFEYITKNDPERMLLVNHAHTQAGSINRGLLPKEERKYIELTYDDTSQVDYYVVCRDDKPDTDIGKENFEKVYSITVDFDEIGAVYKKIK